MLVNRPPLMAIEELSLFVQRHDRSVPHIGMEVQAASAFAPESDEFFRRDVIARQRQRHHETLPLERIEELAAIRVIVRAPDQGALAFFGAGRRGLFGPVAPAEQIAVAHRVVARVQSLALPAELEHALGDSALIAGIHIDGAPPRSRPAHDLDREALGVIHETAVAFETGLGGEDYGTLMCPPYTGGRHMNKFPSGNFHDGIMPAARLRIMPA